MSENSKKVVLKVSTKVTERQKELVDNGIANVRVEIEPIQVVRWASPWVLSVPGGNFSPQEKFSYDNKEIRIYPAGGIKQDFAELFLKDAKSVNVQESSSVIHCGHLTGDFSDSAVAAYIGGLERMEISLPEFYEIHATRSDKGSMLNRGAGEFNPFILRNTKGEYCAAFSSWIHSLGTDVFGWMFGAVKLPRPVIKQKAGNPVFSAHSSFRN